MKGLIHKGKRPLPHPSDGQREQVVGEAVEIGEHGGVHRLGPGQRHHAPLAGAGLGSRHVEGSVGEIISVAISAIIGVAIMSAGFQGWLLWKLNWLERIVFIAGGLLMFIPGTLTDITGLVIAVALLLVNVKKWEKGPKFIMNKHKAKQEQK